MSATVLLSLLDNLPSGATIGTIIVGVAVVVVVGKYVYRSNDNNKATKQEVKKKQSVSNKKTTALDPEKYLHFALKEKQILTHNTRLFRFALPKEDDILGLPIGQHMSFRATIEGKEVYRPYTPVTSDDELGYFDLVVKVYPQGKMSQYLDHLKIGDTIEVKGPKGKFKYEPNMKRAFGMLAGGTGITPMLQVIQAVLKNPKDKTKLSLIFANVTEEDILVRETLEGLAEKHPDQFSLFYTLNEAPEGWTHGKGFVSTDMIKEHLPAPADDIQIVMCGPTPMNNAMLANLGKLGYAEHMSFVF